MACIRIAGWRAAYRGIVPNSFLEGLNLAEEERKVEAALASKQNPFMLTVAERACAIEGYIVYPQPLPQFEDKAEIKALYVNPALQRSGTGSVLLEHALDTLRSDFETLIIWCLEENSIGRSFYEKQGGQLLGKPQTFALPEAPEIELLEVGYVWDLR